MVRRHTKLFSWFTDDSSRCTDDIYIKYVKDLIFPIPGRATCFIIYGRSAVSLSVWYRGKYADSLCQLLNQHEKTTSQETAGSVTCFSTFFISLRKAVYIQLKPGPLLSLTLTILYFDKCKCSFVQLKVSPRKRLHSWEPSDALGIDVSPPMGY